MVTHPPKATVEARIREIELNMERLSRVNTNVAPVPATDPRSWLERWFPGISLVAFTAFAFWLGTISATVNNAVARTEKVYGIVLESKDGLTARTSVIESRIGVIESRISVIESRIGVIESRIGVIESRTTGIESQLDAISKKLDKAIGSSNARPPKR